MKQRELLPPVIKKDKLLSKKGFVKALKDSEFPDFDLEKQFDHSFKEGGKVAMGKDKKKTGRDKIANSFKKTQSNNKSFYNYEPF